MATAKTVQNENKKNTKSEVIPDEELYYDPRRVGKNVIEQNTTDVSGVGMARDAQREQIQSAEMTKALKVREELDQRDDVDFSNPEVDGVGTDQRKARNPENRGKGSLTETRKDLEHVRTYEGDPAPDGTDHVVGVDWYNNKTATLDDRFKSQEQLDEINQQRLEQGALPGSKKDDPNNEARTEAEKKKAV